MLLCSVFMYSFEFNTSTELNIKKSMESVICRILRISDFWTIEKGMWHGTRIIEYKIASSEFAVTSWLKNIPSKEKGNYLCVKRKSTWKQLKLSNTRNYAHTLFFPQRERNVITNSESILVSIDFPAGCTWK